jgi:hypothetical protein
MKGRATIESELELVLGPNIMDSNKITRGQTRGKTSFFTTKVESNKSTTGLFKSKIKIKDKTLLSTSMDTKLKALMTPLK